MRLLLGKQIVLKEFLNADFVISWVDEVVPGAEAYLIGSEKGFIYFVTNSEEIHFGNDNDVICTNFGKMAVFCVNEVPKWETIWQIKEKGADILVIFANVVKLADLLLMKSICWGCALEFKIPIFMVAKHSNVLHYHFTMPGQENNDLIIDTTSTVILDIDVLKNQTGTSFFIKTSAWNWLE
ncbi:hypothetical protein [Pseudothermotoga thermarum]|uniref:Uncharacterized protein n=1 Tax=Pseudothermotoga thermarum DSM 5069 TaxID=688269 RepID=F7YY37_9THEM|nr:hypothetical protein [Pseudothermotoga thermarum]AEH50847.1 hypothetical protein Theth_0762 [Pseudothermotoga thermarum DSM 5069]